MVAFVSFRRCQCPVEEKPENIKRRVHCTRSYSCVRRCHLKLSPRRQPVAHSAIFCRLLLVAALSLWRRSELAVLCVHYADHISSGLALMTLPPAGHYPGEMNISSPSSSRDALYPRGPLIARTVWIHELNPNLPDCSPRSWTSCSFAGNFAWKEPRLVRLVCDSA